MLFCLCMAADIAAAHLHVFSPLPKTTNEQQKEFCSSLPYFPSSYFASHMSVASSSSSVSESKRSNGSAGSSKYVMLEGRPGYQTSSKASSTTGSALTHKKQKAVSTEEQNIIPACPSTSSRQTQAAVEHSSKATATIAANLRLNSACTCPRCVTFHHLRTQARKEISTYLQGQGRSGGG